MPKSVIWHDMVGRETGITGGPYTGMKGVIQSVAGGKITLGYMDRNSQPRTIVVEQRMVKMPLEEGEVYSG